MNSFGKNFRLSIFGESHGAYIGVTIDGLKSGIPLCKADFLPEIIRRKSGAKGTTPRTETDEPTIISGVYNGFTTGAPLTLIFANNNTQSTDYTKFINQPRPGHADYVSSIKWHNFNDPRGGGHFSGRLTLPIVAAGVIARKMLNNIKLKAQIVELGGCKDKSLWNSILHNTIAQQDSIGGIVECTVDNVPIGIGEPFFNSVESLISHAIFSIPGVRGIEFGDGFRASSMKGAEHNDSLCIKNNNITFIKNGAGGINGGLTNGSPIIFRVAFKPTSSIGKQQITLNLQSMQTEPLQINGRHDVCFALRTPPIVEAMTAIVLADLIGA